MITEEMLREAAGRTWEEYVSGLLADYDPTWSPEFSLDFEKKIRRLRRRADHPVLYCTLRRVAVFFLALLAFGTVWIAVDTDARAGFFGWFGEFTGYYYKFHHVGATGKTEIGRAAGYRPAWIPEGFTEASIVFFDNMTTVRYVNEFGELLRFSYVISEEDDDWFFNDSQGELRECRVGNQPATLFLSSADGTASAVTWTDSRDTAFHISGFLSEDELIRMAESVSRG